ncbi:LysR family transcriptional regulator [Pelagibacterium sp. H642]|uniref:LysR family transcriptional regulator n=1 Tax=Pelagibacterium sp. H642 TaxID=1881069 RepID=UPI0028160B5C|nr:LysR family transcriptional regulator [Pelagibacterium sp. H642]WMT92908.1 LysR family transcriptional regulator [Pelagibacterium sp. H642]
MELRQLSFFVTLAEELHFGRAAARLNIAQPALTVQIQNLERELGVQLLIRSTRRVQMTKAGSVFYERCRRILNDLDNSCSIARAIAGKDLKKLTIGTIYPATFGILPSFLAKIGRRFPDIKIHVRTGTSEAIIREIESGTVNIGFIRPLENLGSLRCLGIGHERYLLAIPADNPLAHSDKVNLTDLRSQKIIAFARSNLSYTEGYFYQQFREHDLLGSVVYTCDDTLSLMSLVSSGLGVGFIPEWTHELPNRDVVLRHVEGIDFKVGLSIAWNKEDPTANRDEIVEMAWSLR